MPTSITYSEDPACYKVGLKIPNNIPSEGTADFAITPELPAGLHFSSSTGIISGTPIATSPSTTYSITSTSTSGSVTIKVDNTNLAAIRQQSNYNQKQNCIQRKKKLNLDCICSVDSCKPKPDFG